MKGTPRLSIALEVGERVRIKATGLWAEVIGHEMSADGVIVRYAVQRSLDLYLGSHQWFEPSELERVS